jgi:hypothetical protein
MKRLPAAQCPDEVVKSLDLGVDQFENPDPVDAVFAEGRSLARGHRLEEIRGIRTAVLLVMSRVDMVLAYCRPAKASRGKI